MENNSFTNTSDPATGDGLTDLTRYTFICFMVCIALVGIPGNAIVVLVLKHFRVKSSTDYFVLAMSCVDLFSAAFNTSCYIIRYVPVVWNFFASDIFCRLHLFSVGFTNTSSTILLAAAAFDRLATTGSTLTNRRPSATRRAKQATIGVIVSSFAASIIFPLTSTFDDEELLCVGVDNLTLTSILHSSVALSYTVIFIVVVVCYTKIVIILKRHHRKTLRRKLNVIDRLTWAKTVKRNKNIVDEKEAKTSTVKNIHQSPSQNNLPQTDFTHRPEHDMDLSAATKRGEKENIDISSVETMEKLQCKIYTVSGENSIKITDTKTQNTTSLEERHSLAIWKNIERDKKLLNRTTLMMFLITSVYIGTWIITFVNRAYKAITSSPEYGLIFLIKNLFMINTITNPIFYCSMSTKFKQNAKALFC